VKLYFRDNFFNAGKTEIMNEHEEVVGEVDLRSTFGSAIDVYDAGGSKLCSGKFPLLSNKWEVLNDNGEQLGRLRYQMSFFTKRFEYEACRRGTFEITSPAFSREYEIYDERGTVVAAFQKVSGWFAADAYC
jgi:uncharacterized protein YxjI